MADVAQQAAKPGGRLQIGPRLTPATKELLDQACTTRMLSVSELVEQALLAYLASPAEAEQTPGIAQTLATLQARVEDIHTALGIVITLLTPKAPEQEPERPKIATYEEMYGPITASDAMQGAGNDDTLLRHFDTVEPPAPVPRRVRRWFTREAP